MSASVGVKMTSAGQACDNDRCSVLVYNPDGPRGSCDAVKGCPACGRVGFAVRFGVAVDEVTS